MRRLLLLYVSHHGEHFYAEGLMHDDLKVYVCGFFPEVGELFHSLKELEAHMRAIDDIETFQVMLLDESKTRIQA